MGLELSEKQRAALVAIKSAPGYVAIKHAGALRSAGLIEQADMGARKPGYTGARITAAGLSEIGA